MNKYEDECQRRFLVLSFSIRKITNNVRIIFIYVYPILLNHLAEPESMCFCKILFLLCFVPSMRGVVDLFFRCRNYFFFRKCCFDFWCDQSKKIITTLDRIHAWKHHRYNNRDRNVGIECLPYIYSIYFWLREIIQTIVCFLSRLHNCTICAI